MRQAPAGRRALALVEVGETARARGELLRLPLGKDRVLARAALAVAEVAGLPALTYRLAGHLRGVTDDDPARAAIPAGRYPIPGWEIPAQKAAAKTGVDVDRALIYAFIRQESKFDSRATSRDGARGLMQILPSTARYIARFGGPSGYRNHHSLYDPAVNLDLGQRYLGYLLAYDAVGRDLFRLATAYNGGPGNLGRWSRETDYGGDPLMFIESLPSRETRLFIERVLTNLWIYRARLGQPAPSLKAIAAGDWPAYVSLDRPSSEIARSAVN